MLRFQQQCIRFCHTRLFTHYSEMLLDFYNSQILFLLFDFTLLGSSKLLLIYASEHQSVEVRQLSKGIVYNAQDF